MQDIYSRQVCHDLNKDDVAAKEPLVCHLRTADGKVVQPVDPEAEAMSTQFPDDMIITVYQNGIPTTLSLTQLIKSIQRG